MAAVDDCPKCAAYEHAVMNRAESDPYPEPPCDHYQMSNQFREWLVSQMRGEVMNQVNQSGLDRMAIIKADDSQATDIVASDESE